MEKTNLIYIYLVISLLLSNIPLIHRFVKGNRRVSILIHRVGLTFSLANTMIHESFHAIFAILTGGRIRGISLFTNTSGVAETSSNSRIAKILVSYAGYTGSTLTSIGLFYLLFIGNYQWIIIFFVVLSAINWLFWIRNFYGFIWLTSFIGVISFLIFKDMDNLLIHISIFLSCVVAVQSVTTAFEIFILSITKRKEAGDATNLAKFTFIPAAFWGSLFLGQSLFAFYFIIRHYLIN